MNYGCSPYATKGILSHQMLHTYTALFHYKKKTRKNAASKVNDHQNGTS